jgi:hypothetical protein
VGGRANGTTTPLPALLFLSGTHDAASYCAEEQEQSVSMFQQLYDSEINFSISCFWDSGFHVRLGDDVNGFVSEARVEMWDEIEPWLRAEAMLHYPESRVAKATLSPP